MVPPARRVVLTAAVLGSPVEHSLSPVLHRAGYAAAGLTGWRYEVHELAAPDLPGFVAGLDDGWRGLSLTMPLKEAALEVADRRSEVAVRAGAANTLVRAPGGWAADNTDVEGLVRALAGVRERVLPGPVTLLGSGATARSAVLALAGLGVTELVVAARNAATAQRLTALFGSLVPGAATSRVPLADWAGEPARLVVSTLPPSGALAAAEAAGRPAMRPWGGGPVPVLLDVVYADWPTPLARLVTAAGGPVVSGLEMLVHQAAAQFELFTGVVPAPVGAMLAAGREALAARARGQG